jgi:hypothetical protein
MKDIHENKYPDNIVGVAHSCKQEAVPTQLRFMSS